jgi:hypothetical protein
LFFPPCWYEQLFSKHVISIFMDTAASSLSRLANAFTPLVSAERSSLLQSAAAENTMEEAERNFLILFLAYSPSPNMAGKNPK